jgi:multiple sugar transport system substrate-binding protein
MPRSLAAWLRWGLAACLVSAFATSPFARTSHAANKVKLTWEIDDTNFWATQSEAIINAYTKLHPNVTVKLITVPVVTYDRKLFLQAALGTLPDIVRTSDGETLPLAAHHILLDMQPYVNADPSFNLSDVYPNFLNLGRLPGQNGLYMMPFSADAVVMVYNKDMFDKAGVGYPTTSWTYQDFLQAAQKLTLRDSGGKVTQWGMDGGWAEWWAVWVPFITGFGGAVLAPDGKHASLSSPRSIAGLQAIADLFFKYKVVPGPTNLYPSDPFISGHAAMGFTVHAGIVGLQQAIGKSFKWDIQLVPLFPNGSRFNGMGTAGWAVSAGSKNRAASRDIIRFVGSVQGQTALARVGVAMPIRRSMLKSPIWQIPGLNNQAFASAIDAGIIPPRLPVDAAITCGTIYMGLLQTATSTMWDQILRGTPVVTAAKTADAAINRCVDSLAVVAN